MPLSSLLKVPLQHHEHILLWFPLGRLQMLRYHPTFLSQVPLCLLLLTSSLRTPVHSITDAPLLCHLHTPQRWLMAREGAEEVL